MKRYILTMPIQPGIELVMYMGADEIQHRNWLRYALYRAVVRAEIVHGGHTIQVEKFEVNVTTRWDAHAAMQIAEEYVASMRTRTTIVVSE